MSRDYSFMAREIIVIGAISLISAAVFTVLAKGLTALIEFSFSNESFRMNRESIFFFFGSILSGTWLSILWMAYGHKDDAQ